MNLGTYPTDTAQNFSIKIVDGSGDPVAGLLNTDVTVFYLKSGDTSFTSKIPTLSEWNELQHGCYQVTFAASELDTAGQFYFYVYHPSYKYELYNLSIQLLSQFTGIEKAEIIVIDQNTDPIQGVAVSIATSDNSRVITYSHITDANGRVFIYLNQGTYKVRLAKNFVNFTLKDLVVPSGGVLETYSGDTFNPDAQTDPDVCLVYGYVQLVSGTSAPDGDVYGYVFTRGTFASGNGILLDKKRVEISDGYFELPLIRGLDVKLELIRQGYVKRFTVPDVASINYASL